MSNLSNFLIFITSSLLLIGLFYILFKKWKNFHQTMFGKFLKVIYAGILIIGIIVTLFGAYISFSNYWEDDRIRVVNEFQGVQLGWSIDEVYFRKGKPEQLDDKEPNNQYLDYGSTIVEMENNKVSRIIFDCRSDGYIYEKVGGISCTSGLDRIINLYGESKEISVSEDKLTRMYNYPRYNLAFILTKARVEGLMVFDSKIYPKGLHFVDNSIAPSEHQNSIEGSVDTTRDKSKPQTNARLVPVEDSPDDLKIDYDKLAAENGATNSELDHCAPSLKKSERLRRLALKGTVRETGYQTYSVGSNEIIFSGNELIRCK